jgi:Zn-dependent peptidase ImmA (M78 family)
LAFKSSYAIRKTGDFTLLTEDIHEMEAHKFAHKLLVPSEHLEKDLLITDIWIAALTVLADQKYNVSLFVLLNRLVEISKDNYSVIQSEKNKIIKTAHGALRKLENM